MNKLQVLEIHSNKILQNYELMEVKTGSFPSLIDVAHTILLPHFSSYVFPYISGLPNSIPVFIMESCFSVLLKTESGRGQAPSAGDENHLPQLEK